MGPKWKRFSDFFPFFPSCSRVEMKTLKLTTVGNLEWRKYWGKNFRGQVKRVDTFGLGSRKSIESEERKHENFQIAVHYHFFLESRCRKFRAFNSFNPKIVDNWRQFHALKWETNSSWDGGNSKFISFWFHRFLIFHRTTWRLSLIVRSCKIHFIEIAEDTEGKNWRKYDDILRSNVNFEILAIFSIF